MSEIHEQGDGGRELPSLDEGLGAAAPRRGRALVWGLLAIAALAALAAGLALLAIRAETSAVHSELEQRLTLQSQRKVEAVSAWLDRHVAETRRLVESELFRLFAFDVETAVAALPAERPTLPGVAEGGTPERPPETLGSFGVTLLEQGPYMKRVLVEFLEGAGFLDGYLVSPTEGGAYLVSDGAPPLAEAQLVLVSDALNAREPRFGPARAQGGHLQLDLAVPVYPPQAEVGGSEPIAGFLFTLRADSRLAEILAVDPLAAGGEATRLLQLAAGPEESFAAEVDPGAAPPLRPLSDEARLPGGGALAFGERPGLDEGARVYSAGLPVPGSAWWIVQEQDAAAAEARLNAVAAAIWTIAGLVSLALLAAFVAFWWRLNGLHSRMLAEQYRAFARRIAAQKRLLDGINDSIVEHIGLKGGDGAYRLVNRAFAEALGRSPGQVVGCKDTEIYGEEVAQRMRRADKSALASGRAVMLSEVLTLQDRRHHVEVSKVPLHSEQGAAEGVVSVLRDVTREVEARERHQRLIDQMVNTLVRAIELRDPYLAGHSRRVAGFALAIAESLGASEDEQETLRVAANLCQIGKLSVPREILVKPVKLSDAELAELRRHLDHAWDMLGDVEFELPVVPTILQMHERIDGKGYPKGLVGDAVLRSAQILGLCDWFSARIEPRGYRAPIEPAAALEVLEDQPERYDPALVAALRAAVESPLGAELLAGLSETPRAS